MPVLGTKKFWKPAPGASQTQKENQIIKNSGYINIQLMTVNYMSTGNFWQNTFGGRDNIALATSVEYQTSTETIVSTSIQDAREVKVNRNYNLGVQRNIAIKIPANADSLKMDVKLTAIANDALQAKFDMLNEPDYQGALQLAPPIVGQLVTVTSLVKKLFTDSRPENQLETSFAGVISLEPEDNPVQKGKLTKGLLIIISTNDGQSFNDVDETKFSLRGDSLYYNNALVENTYMIFNISFEAFKGDDERANWFRKYNESLNNLDKIQLTTDATEIQRIYNDSKTLWIEGNALLEADMTYINKEKIKIKTAAFTSLTTKYNELTQGSRTTPKFASLTDSVLTSIAGTNATADTILEALPVTGSTFMNKSAKTQMSKAVSAQLFQHLTPKNSKKVMDSLMQDTKHYITALPKSKAKFSLQKYAKVNKIKKGRK